jgi:hypothetical protein
VCPLRVSCYVLSIGCKSPTMAYTWKVTIKEREIKEQSGWGGWYQTIGVLHHIVWARSDLHHILFLGTIYLSNTPLILAAEEPERLILRLNSSEFL